MSLLRVLFLCTGNSARSILGEYLLRALAPDRFVTASAGSSPKGSVHPMTTTVLRESWGIHAADAWSKSLDQLEGEFDLVITVCDHARDACPLWSGETAVAHWGLPDPAAVAGHEEEVRTAFEQTADELHRRFRALVELPLESMTRDERARAMAGLAG